nr:hypothetical protein [Tanacetum cinerariifolium]
KRHNNSHKRRSRKHANCLRLRSNEGGQRPNCNRPYYQHYPLCLTTHGLGETNFSKRSLRHIPIPVPLSEKEKTGRSSKKPSTGKWPPKQKPVNPEDKAASMSEQKYELVESHQSKQFLPTRTSFTKPTYNSLLNQERFPSWKQLCLWRPSGSGTHHSVSPITTIIPDNVNPATGGSNLALEFVNRTKDEAENTLNNTENDIEVNLSHFASSPLLALKSQTRMSSVLRMLTTYQSMSVL